MKISIQWLREWVDLTLSPAALAERLTMAGLEVDSIEPAAPPLSGVRVGRVLATKAHPNADKLTCCQIDSGEGATVDVVCGAPNVRAGLHVAYASPGAELPDGRVIKRTTIREVDSSGMLCSAAELALGDDAGGLLELANDAPLGVSIREYLQLDDEIIDVDLTPNRGDCLSLLGVAREVAALTNCEIPSLTKSPTAAAIDDELPITLDVPVACPRYAGRVIKNVDAAAPTPMWIQERLRRCGIRSISAIVDITNYVMMEFGQPMHGFDLDRLNGCIRVRNSRAGESLALLDGQTIELDADTLIIADENDVLALAGVMGGAASGVETHTNNVYLESAYFDAITLAGVARRYRLHTDASHRFERGVDFTGQERAIERATALILQVCGGDAGPVSVAEAPDCIPVRTAIEFDTMQIARVIGIDIPASEARSIFESLQCDVDDIAGKLSVTPPDFRFDLELEADLLEEIARVHGYDNIQATLPNAALTHTTALPRREQDRCIRDTLVTLGYSEAITYSFIAPRDAQAVTPSRSAYALANPISADMAVMRTSIWPGLINAAMHNLNRQVENIRMFELGSVFDFCAEDLVETHVLAGIALGDKHPKQWGVPPCSIDLYDIKQELENVLGGLGVVGGEWVALADGALHPGQSAGLELAGETLAKIGILHPGIAKLFELNQDVVLFEVMLGKLPVNAVASYAPVSKFPQVKRDLSVVLDDDTPAGEILACVRKVGGKHLRDLQLFDEYRGQGIDSDKKSLALGLIFQAHSSTLTDEEIEETMERVLMQLHSDFGGTLRK